VCAGKKEGFEKGIRENKLGRKRKLRYIL